MSAKANTAEDYILSLEPEKKEALSAIRNTILSNIPNGFEETMSYGMIGYVVPFSLFPNGYHCDPKLPLPFAQIAAQKNFIAIYHMGLYADADLLNWFTTEHAKASKKKLDMGKSCIRYKKAEDIPFKLIGELFSKITVDQYIETYTNNLAKSKKSK
jgi:hypothetical protein